MPWERIVDSENTIVQWAALGEADACFARALELASEANIAANQRAGWGVQSRVARDAVEWLAAGYRNLTAPGTRDPELIARREQWGRELRGRLDRALRAAGEHGYTYAWVTRLSFDNNDRPQFVCMGATPRDDGDACQFDGIFTGCVEPPSTEQGCDPYTWRAIAWKGGAGVDELNVLPPAVWPLEWVRDVAAACVRRGARATLVEIRLNVALHNFQEVQRLTELGVELPEGIDDARLGEAARVIEEAQRDANSVDSPRMHEVSAGILTAAAAALALPQPAGAIAGAVLGAIGALVRFLPDALGIDPRRIPNVWSGYIEGTGPGEDQRPTWDPVAPPGYTAPRTLTLVDPAGFLLGQLARGALDPAARATADRLAGAIDGTPADGQVHPEHLESSGPGGGGLLLFAALAALALASR
jgi:hypothetical protein